MKVLLFALVAVVGCDAADDEPRRPEPHRESIPIEGQIDLKLSPVIVDLLELRRHAPALSVRGMPSRTRIDELLTAMLQFQCADEGATPDPAIYDAILARELTEIMCSMATFSDGTELTYDRSTRRWARIHDP